MVVLFQGDSITEAGRNREDADSLGHGYAKLLSDRLQELFPQTSFKFYNRGIGGNDSRDLLKRVDQDIIALEPDVVSVFVGINDIWHRHFGDKVQSKDEEFEANYRAIMERIRKETHAKIAVVEPYLLYEPSLDFMREEVVRIRAIVQRLAAEYADAYLPLGTLLDEHCPSLPEPDFYSKDGIHPNAECAHFIAEQYLPIITPLIAELQ